jgi:hypothetical protein
LGNRLAFDDVTKTSAVGTRGVKITETRDSLEWKGCSWPSTVHRNNSKMGQKSNDVLGPCRAYPDSTPCCWPSLVRPVGLARGGHLQGDLANSRMKMDCDLFISFYPKVARLCPSVPSWSAAPGPSAVRCQDLCRPLSSFKAAGNSIPRRDCDSLSEKFLEKWPKMIFVGRQLMQLLCGRVFMNFEP